MDPYVAKDPPELASLKNYTACDVADAIVALKSPEYQMRPHAGFLCDIAPRREPSGKATSYVGPAFTVQFQPKDGVGEYPKCQPMEASSNIPPGEIWSDMAEPGSIVVVQAPEGQRNAVVGGIHMQRLKMLGVQALVVDGRIRDQRELAELDMPVFSKGTSIVGGGFASKQYAVQLPITAAEVLIEPGDIVVADSGEGVVSIPRGMVKKVLEWLENRGDKEDRIMSSVKSGMSVQEAFSRYR